MEICFGIANGQNLSIFDRVICLPHVHVFVSMFTKCGMSIDIVEIWFEIANGKILSISDRVICPPHICIFISDDNLSKCQWIFTKLGMCIDIVAIWFGLQMGKLHQLLTELSAHHMIMAGYYHFRAQLFKASLA